MVNFIYIFSYERKLSGFSRTVVIRCPNPTKSVCHRFEVCEDNSFSAFYEITKFNSGSINCKQLFVECAIIAFCLT